jgi:predicted ATP-grasp superfamily ATP-dependent carboligase
MKQTVDTTTGEVVDQLKEHDFSVFIATAEDGILDEDCSQALRDLTSAVMKIGKLGKMTLTVEEKNLLMKLLIDQVQETEYSAFTDLCDTLRVGLAGLHVPPAIFYGCDR